jgi:hypothetical protein
METEPFATVVQVGPGRRRLLMHCEAEAEGWLILAVLTRWLHDDEPTMPNSRAAVERLVALLEPLVAPEGSAQALVLAALRAARPEEPVP